MTRDKKSFPLVLVTSILALLVVIVVKMSSIDYLLIKLPFTDDEKIVYFNFDGQDGGKLLGAKQNQDEKALNLLLVAARNGDAEAQHNLGVKYIKGNGIDRDIEEGVMWIRKAAMQAYARAQYDLGLLHAKGEGVPKDYGMAYTWFDIAATHEDEAPEVATIARKNLDELEHLFSPKQRAELQLLGLERVEQSLGEVSVSTLSGDKSPFDANSSTDRKLNS